MGLKSLADTKGGVWTKLVSEERAIRLICRVAHIGSISVSINPSSRPHVHDRDSIPLIVDIYLEMQHCGETAR